MFKMRTYDIMTNEPINGQYIIKRGELYYRELWVDGERIRFKRVTEEEIEHCQPCKMKYNYG